MVKSISLLILFSFIVVSGYWLAINSGELTILILDYQIKTNLVVAFLCLIMIIVTLFLTVWLFKGIITLPSKIKNYLLEKKTLNLLAAQRSLIISMSCKNHLDTRKFAGRIAKVADDASLKEVCEILSYDIKSQENIELLKSKVSSKEALYLLSLFLLELTIQQENWPKARLVLEEMWAKSQDEKIMRTLIEMYIKLESWADLEEFVDNNINKFTRSQAAAIRCIVRYNLAKEALREGEIATAFEDLVDLLKIYPKFRYAFSLLVDICIKHKIKGRILGIARSYFARNQSTEVTIAIIRLVELFPSDKLYEFALRISSDNEGSLEGKIILAQFALNARMYDQAFREISDCCSVHGKTTRICLLMAEFCQRTQGVNMESIDWIKSALTATNDIVPQQLYLNVKTLEITDKPSANKVVELFR
ncbi:MAG: putative enzyme of heme biosynthesis (HemY-like) protein [Candidatus Midichloriaceae bacterium]|jgi:HemY protein|nr:putative enzyme of heme biosynthesis (HemY-like) protein [Candidatus Midichloriaceae bacterium]